MKRSKSQEPNAASAKKAKPSNYSKPDDTAKPLLNKQKVGNKPTGVKSSTATKSFKSKKPKAFESNGGSESGTTKDKKEFIKSKLGKKGKEGKFNKFSKFSNKKGKKVPHELDKLLDEDGKPKWDEYKEQKKKLKEQRKLHRAGPDQHQLSVKAKAIWEKLRECTAQGKRKKEQGKSENKNEKEEKEALVNELFMLLKGQIPNMIQSHDMTRVIQWMLKLGSASVRSAVCEELCSNTVLYLKSKYASFCILKALKYGSKHDRDHIIQSCNGNFLTLLSYSYAIPVVELMYSMFASMDQRRQMHVELYGEMCALLSADVSRIEDIPADMKPAITVAAKANIIKLLSKKQLLQTTYFQSVLNDFLTSCSKEDCNDILELIQTELIEFLNTKEGKRVALRTIWLATNKMKKIIVKSMKTKVKEIATNEEGHMMLLALFDCVDDTVLVHKALISELLEDIKEVVNNEVGRKVILYLVAHRDLAYFHPTVVETLAKGDTISSRKKDSEVRVKELRDGVSKPLLDMIASEPGFWLGDSSIAMVSLAIMKSGQGETVKKAFEGVVSYMLDTNSVLEVKNRQFHVIEHSALHLVFKKLIQLENPDEPSATFSSILVSRLTEEHLDHFIQFNRGCFLLVLLLESKNKKMCKMLKSKITDSMKSFLQDQETTGSKILLKKLSGEK